jgi:hypothetical protein
LVQVIDDPYSGNVFGRLGAGIGQGLSEHLPKEIERMRLSSGLKKLNQENVQDPFEFYTKALGIPGITPQMVESLGRLSEKRLQAQGLKNFGKQGGREGAENLRQLGAPTQQAGNTSAIPSVTTPTGLQATTHPFIPRSTPEKYYAAAQKYEVNPGLYGNDIEKAVLLENQIDNDMQAQNSALQLQRTGETDVQNTVRTSLANQHALLKSNVPATIFSKIEDEAIRSVLSTDQGGRNLTEQQAAKEYGDKLRRISEDYTSIVQLRNTGLQPLQRGEIKRKIENLQKRMAERGEQKEFADRLISDANLTPRYAFRIAYPASDSPKAVEAIDALPDQKAKGPIKKGRQRISYEEQIPKIAESMGKNSSPISIADALEKRGYDSTQFLKFLNDNKDELLTPNQSDQLKYINERPTLQDLFLFPDLIFLQ